MINLNLIYDDCIDIWMNGYYRRVILNPTPYILSDYIYDEFNVRSRSVVYDYSNLNLTGRIIDLRTNV